MSFNVIFKVCIRALGSILIGACVANVAGEIFARIYASVMGVPLDSLSEDYRMGFYGIIFEVGAFVLAAIASFALLSYFSEIKNCLRRREK